jgi:hypothetical protein
MVPFTLIAPYNKIIIISTLYMNKMKHENLSQVLSLRHKEFIIVDGKEVEH